MSGIGAFSFDPRKGYEHYFLEYITFGTKYYSKLDGKKFFQLSPKEIFVPITLDNNTSSLRVNLNFNYKLGT